MVIALVVWLTLDAMLPPLKQDPIPSLFPFGCFRAQPRWNKKPTILRFGFKFYIGSLLNATSLWIHI